MQGFDLRQRMRQGDVSVWPSWNPKLIEASELRAAWREAISRRGTAGFPTTIRAYTHFAYCESSCNFCMYWHKVPGEPDAYRKHTDYLVHQVERFREDSGRVKIESAYFGGGTPTAAPLPELERYLQAFRGAFEVQGEFTVEGHPMVTTPEKLAALAGHGVNRLSMGVQTHDPTVLVKITRRNGPSDQVAVLVNEAHRHGMIVNLDLVLGLPGQSLASFQQSVLLTAALGPDSVMLYLYNPVRRLPEEPGSEMTYLSAFSSGLLEQVDALGYEPVDNWRANRRAVRLKRKDRRPSPLDSNRLAYCQFHQSPSSTIALGPGAYGHVFGRYWYRDVSAMSRITEHDPRYFGTALSPVDEARSILMAAIDRAHPLDGEALLAELGVDIRETFPEALRLAETSGLLHQDRGKWIFRPGDHSAILDLLAPPRPERQQEHFSGDVEFELVATHRDEEQRPRWRELLQTFCEELAIPSRGYQICRGVWVGMKDDHSIYFHVGSRGVEPLRVIIQEPGASNAYFRTARFSISHNKTAPTELERRFLAWLTRRMLAAPLKKTTSPPA